MQIFRPRIPVDHRAPSPPYSLAAQNLFARRDGNEIFIKKISSTEKGIQRRGNVIIAPGIGCNANLFRIRPPDGEALTLDHNQSFANLLAAEGFNVYLYHPSYTERTHNRYVARYCPESIHYQQRYDVPSTLTFDQMVNQELPLVIDFVHRDSKSSSLSWIGYSMGGMLIYAYLSKYTDGRIKNVITIGSPVSLTQVIARVIGYLNSLSKVLGFEERTFVGAISENLVPLTRLIANLPGLILRFNPLAPSLYNPANIESSTLKTFFGKVVEPIPSGLENSFAHFTRRGFSSLSGDFDYFKALPSLEKGKRNFLFFYGQLDMLAPPDSVLLAHERISPKNEENIIGINGAGHIDLIIGRRSQEEVWIPSVNWLKEKQS